MTRAVQWVLILIALVFLGLFLVTPLVAVFAEALDKGLGLYWESIREDDARSAIYLTLTIAAIAVPLNTVFGLAAAWTITKFDFRGKNLLLTLIDIPFAVSPVIFSFVTSQGVPETRSRSSRYFIRRFVFSVFISASNDLIVSDE